MDVAALNATFPKYPVTMEDKGWVYGVWYCGTAWDKVRLHGQYPPTFLKRALALFPDAKDILHCPSGTLKDVPGITVDAIRDDARDPQIVADAAALPFPDGAFDLILSDPPYTSKDSEIYGCKPFPLGKFMKEAHRTLRPGGHLGMLHTYYPIYRRKTWKLCGLIAVVTGFQRATRMFSIFERLPNSADDQPARHHPGQDNQKEVPHVE
jgi:SAM-dependent methyltransferase